MGWWNSTIAMNPDLSSKFTLSDHKTVTVFVKRFHSKTRAPVHDSIATKTLKVGSKMTIAASAPVLPNQKKQCRKIARFTDAPYTSGSLRKHLDSLKPKVHLSN
jgi:hypothetical protein